MFRFYTAVSLIALMSACGSGTQPFNFSEAEVEEPEEGSEVTTPEEAAENTGELEATTPLPGGTAAPTPTNSIFRFESRDGNGGGLVTSVKYNATNDEFTVDNLGFDGANVYERGALVDTLGVTKQQYAVYDADDITFDNLDGDPISQNGPYRAIVGVSDNLINGEARTAFAIVRTGGYRNYGFGGFVYERNGGVTLPVSGQAHFDGEYAGVRVFDGRGGLEFTTGNIDVDIDFSDFNANDAVNGTLTDRLVFAADGTPISTGGAGELLAPDVYFTVVEGVQTLTENGEISGTLSNTVNNEAYEAGTYYGILGGDLTKKPGGELVGVFVIESQDSRNELIGVQETGGFILYR